MITLETAEERAAWVQFFSGFAACGDPSDGCSEYADNAIKRFRARLPKPTVLEQAVSELDAQQQRLAEGIQVPQTTLTDEQV